MHSYIATFVLENKIKVKPFTANNDNVAKNRTFRAGVLLKALTVEVENTATKDIYYNYNMISNYEWVLI